MQTELIRSVLWDYILKNSNQTQELKKNTNTTGNRVKLERWLCCKHDVKSINQGPKSAVTNRKIRI